MVHGGNTRLNHSRSKGLSTAVEFLVTITPDSLPETEFPFLD